MKKIILLVLVLFSLKSIAQKDAQNVLGAWYMYGGSHKISGKFSAKTLAHFRFFDMGDDLEQLLIRVAVNYKLNNIVNFSLGYAHFDTDHTYNQKGGNVVESRIYEDININHYLNQLGFAHRIRFEQRFLTTEFRNHVRYQIGLSQPVYKKISAFVYNEVFLNFTGKNFDQNWLGGGLKYKLNSNFKFELGYQKIFFHNSKNFDRLLVGILLTTH